uniref:PDZ domain-containing protein n=1 Tax=Oryzias latipes TaxID=8090 RepID=A0A3P9L9H3_ORYLA
CPAAERSGVEDDFRKSVEIVVETDAEVGASGYSVMGGGERGIFVKDVLKDSPAAKHLSLQQGDQLLSAKVYFDNVRYEDALKILQCAEPYKVSFQLKRTVPETEVSVRPRILGGEVKGPKAKVAKMVIPLFILLKEKNKEDVVMDGTPPSLEAGDVDVEFSLPTFRQRKGVNEAEPVVGKGKKRIRLCFLIILEGQAGKEGEFKMPTVDVLMPKLKQAEGPIEGPEMMSGVEIQLPSHDASVPTAKMKGNIEIEGPSAKGGKFTMPSVNIKLPQMGSTEAGVDLHGQKMGVATGDVSLKPMGDIEGKFPKGDVTLEGPDLNLSLPSSGNKVKGDSDGGKFKMPTCDISLQKGKIKEGEMNIREPEVKGEKFQMPSFDVSLPQIRKRGEDVDVELPKLKGGEIKAPTIEISPVQGTFEGNFDLESDGKEGEFRLHGMKFPEGEGNFQGPKVKGAKFEMPKIDLSLPRGKTQGAFHTEIHSGKDGNIEMASCDFDVPKGELSADINVDGLERKTEKFKLPKIDISLPKLNLPEGEVKFEGPETKGQMEKPSLDIIPPEGKLDVDVDGRKAKGSKFHMPTININLPKIKSKEVSIDVKGPEGEEGKLPSCDITLPDKEFPEANVSLGGPNVKGGQINVPGVEGLLPETNGKAGISVETPEGNLEKLQMPKFDIAIPKLNFPDSAGKMKKPDLKIKKMEMPDIDIPLSKGKAEADIEIDGGKGKTFHIPSVDFSLPRIKTKGSEVKTGGFEEKIQMPDTDVSLSRGKVEVDTNVEGPEVKGGKFKMPKFDISFPDKNLPEGKPEVDISITKGKIKEDVDLGGKGKGDIETTGSSHKGGKFHMPAIDITLPKIKTKGAEVHVESPEVKGGQIKMPTLHVSGPKLKSPDIDVSLKGPEVEGKIKEPKGEVQGDFEVEGPDMKGGKFKMPKFDVSLPKVSLPKFDANVEGPDLKGKAEMLSVDNSVPRAATDVGVDVDTGKESECTTPTFDVSLPKVALTDGDSKIEGPDIKGRKIQMPDIDLSLPKGKGKGDIETTGSSHKGGKFYMPAIDITLPKMKTKGAEVHVESPKVKGGQIKIPSLDVSGPKLKSPDIDVSLKGPEVEGNIKNAKGNISLPKGEVQGDFEVEGPEMKGGKFKMPKFDVSLPKVSLPKFDASVEGPDLKGKAEMPSVYISVPKATTDVALPKPEGDFEVESPDIKGGKFKMPKFDLSLPKVSLPKFDASVEGPDLKGKAEMQSVDISVPKATTDVEVDVDTGKGSTFHMPSLDISLPKIKAKVFDVNIEGPEFKGDISLPEVRSPDVDFNLQGPEVEGGKLGLPKVNVALPKTEGDFEVEGPDMKGGKFKMPKFDVSLPKVSLPKFDASVEGPDLKGKAEIRSVEMSVPKGTTDLGVDVDTGKFYMPSLDISLPKMKGKKFDVNVEGPEVKGDISLPEVRSPDVDFNLQGSEVEGGNLGMPNVDIALPKTEGDIEVEGPDMKGGKFKMPKFDLSLPKVRKGFDVNIEGPEVKGDISLPEVKSPDVDFNFQGPEVKGGKLSLPKVDIALPKTEGDFEVEGPDIKGGKFKMPKFDVSLPNVSLPKFDASVEGPDLKGKAEMPSVDISVPKGTTNLGVDVDTGKGSKFHMPSLDISLPKMKTKGLNVNVEGPEVRVERGDVKMPTLDVSLPKPEGDSEIQGPEVKGGKYKMPKLPKVSLPEANVKVIGPDINVGKIEMPDIDISLPKGKAKDIDFSLPRGEGDADLNLEGPEKRGQVKMPKVDVSFPQIKLAGDVIVEGPEMKGKITEPVVDFSKGERKMEGDIKKAMGLHMPSIDLHLPKVDFDLSLPSGSKGRGLKVDTSGPDASADVQMSGTAERRGRRHGRRLRVLLHPRLGTRLCRPANVRRAPRQRGGNCHHGDQDHQNYSTNSHQPNAYS